jgi:hypothetical protein
MARHGGPHLQRVLRIEGDRVIYEAILGAAPSGPLDGRTRQLLQRTLKPLHDAGVAHGSLASSLLLDEGGATLLVAGRGPQAGAAPSGDLAALDKF